MTTTTTSDPTATETRRPCTKCGAPNHIDNIWCYWCQTTLIEVPDWNPNPWEWFAAVGPRLLAVG